MYIYIYMYRCVVIYAYAPYMYVYIYIYTQKTFIEESSLSYLKITALSWKWPEGLGDRRRYPGKAP